MKKTWFFVFAILMLPVPAWSELVYQDFEASNGTQPAYGQPMGAVAEYGWGFNGAVCELSHTGDPVHEGLRSWKATIPAGKPVQAGCGIAAQTQAFHINFVPQCHDRLSFWVWSDPGQVGDHTVMIKFFDQGVYKHQGFGIWTKGQARYREWTHLMIPFSSLPADFNLSLVDKIEFFHYWDGTYFYDDITVDKSVSTEDENLCLKMNFILHCFASPEKCHSVVANDHKPFLDIIRLRQQRLTDIKIAIDHD